jgi:hypothetical protein
MSSRLCIGGEGRSCPVAWLSILVDALCKAVEAKVGGEVAIVVLFTIRIKMQMECRHSVGVIGLLDSSEEDAATCAVIVVEVHFCLKAKVQ